MTTVQQDTSQLARAIELVVADYREEGNPDATVEEALASTLAELDLDDIQTLRSGPEPLMTAEVAEAYRTVLTADHADVCRQADVKIARPADVGDAVVEVEHPDAATAVAAAAAAVASANQVHPDQPVIVVVTEDVRDWVDEDPGF